MDKFFAASNSAHGFCSYYNECFSNLDRLYIIKGGPGTGKSGFMRRVFVTALERGYKGEKFYCSSDQDSLDGIILYRDGKSVGFIDGTSPHSFDMRIAGAVDNIINLGELWREEELAKKRDEIINLSAKKSGEYSVAYKYLCSCANLSAVINLYISECVNTEKLMSASAKLTGTLAVGEKYSERIRLIDSVGMRGRVRFDSLERGASGICLLGDMFGVGSMMLRAIRENLREKRRSILISYDPICPDKINGLFDIESKLAFILSDDRAEGISNDKIVSHINMKRFIFPDKLSEQRSNIKYARTLYEKSLNGALDAFGRIEKYHFALEKIYGESMDFQGVDGLIERYCELI